MASAMAFHGVTGRGNAQRLRICMFETGEGPGFGKGVCSKAMAGLFMETQPGATSADVLLDSAVTGAGARCLTVLALNPADESQPRHASRSSG